MGKAIRKTHHLFQCQISAKAVGNRTVKRLPRVILLSRSNRYCPQPLDGSVKREYQFQHSHLSSSLFKSVLPRSSDEFYRKVTSLGADIFSPSSSRWLIHDIIVRYNDALSLLGGKTACVQNVVPKFPTRFAATRRPMATQEMGKTLVFNLYKFRFPS